MKILLTGAFGNVGGSTIEELVGRGHDVRCLDVRSPLNEKVAASYGNQAEVRWGDVRKVEDVEKAMEGRDAVIHLAFIIPSAISRSGRSSEDHPEWAEEINVGGTRNVVEAAKKMDAPPRLVFASSVSLYGFTHDREPPVKVDDPVTVSDHYTDHKMKCEELVTGSGLEWVILRFSAIPALGVRMTPEMFDVPLDNRIEFTHTRDVGTACANAAGSKEAAGKRLIVAGGTRCQMTYGEMIGKSMKELGLGEMPAEAFTDEHRYFDWYDTEESQELLRYQNHTYDDYLSAVKKELGLARHLAALFSPVARWYMLRQSPYYRENIGVGPAA